MAQLFTLGRYAHVTKSIYQRSWAGCYHFGVRCIMVCFAFWLRCRGHPKLDLGSSIDFIHFSHHRFHAHVAVFISEIGQDTSAVVLGSYCVCCQLHSLCWLAIYSSQICMSYRPNKSPEPTAVGAVRSAVAVHVAGRRWLSFFR